MLLRTLYVLLTIGLSMALTVDIQNGHTVQAVIDAILILANTLFLIFNRE